MGSGKLTILIGCAVAAAMLTLAYVQYERTLTRPIDVPAGADTYHFRQGASLGSLARDLEALGIVPSATALVLWGRATGVAGALKAGDYELASTLTPIDLITNIAAGKVKSYRFTILEGWTLEETLAAIGTSPRVDQDLAGLDRDAVISLLGIAGGNGEGRLFPDTYLYVANTPASKILAMAKSNMEAVLTELWQGRDSALPLTAPQEALTLASMVEKETGLDSDRAEIAGVFVGRLRRNMRLQSDPTVIYALGEAFDGNLESRHLRLASPYNTYVHKGLPPGPICNPGRASIEAAMNPAVTDSLYFVARGDGSSHFSATLEEHNRAVARYQLNSNGR